MPLSGRLVGPVEDELRVNTVGVELGKGVVLTVETDVVVGETVTVVGDFVGLDTGFTGAAVFRKHAQPLDKRVEGTPARFFGAGSLDAVRYLGQKAAASLEKRSMARSVLSS